MASLLEAGEKRCDVWYSFPTTLKSDPEIFKSFVNLDLGNVLPRYSKLTLVKDLDSPRFPFGNQGERLTFLWFDL